jgi:hypothetical protein
MDTKPAFGLNEVLAHIVGDIAKAVSERPGESQHQQFTRTQAAAQTILAFRPGDAIEAMLAGHCLMFHEMIVDSIPATMRGMTDTERRATRSNIVAMDKAFGNNLIRLERYRARDAAAEPEAGPVDARAETDIADRVRRHQPGAPEAMSDNTAPTVGLAGLNRQGRREMVRKRLVPAMTRYSAVTPTRNAPTTKAFATPAG